MEMKEIMKEVYEKGSSTKVNLDYLIGILNGFKEGGRTEVKLTIAEEYPLVLDDLIMIAPMVPT